MVAIGKIMEHSIVQLPHVFGDYSTTSTCFGDYSTTIPFKNLDATTSRTKYFLDKVSRL